MTVTLVGGTGFIGEYLINALIKNTGIEILVLYKNNLPENKFSNVKYFQIDQNLKQVLSRTDCLVILTQPNLNLIKNILKFASGIKKIVYASTLHLYPDSESLQDESIAIRPSNDYETGKAEEEKLLLDYLKKSKIKLMIARITNVYGDIKNKGIIQKIFKAILNQETFAVNNSGQQVRDYIFIEDVARYLIFLITKTTKKQLEIFNISTGIGYSILAVIKQIETVTHKKLLKTKGLNIMEKNSIIGDNKKIIKSAGFKPKYNLKSGVKKTYQNYLKQI